MCIRDRAIFSVLIIADVMASSLDNPFCIALQNFLEKFFDILFWRRLTVGSEVWDAIVFKGCKKTTAKNTKLKKSLDNSLYLLTVDIINNNI